VGLHAQQTVEKALKAVLIQRGIDYPFTHDLGLLIERCEVAGLRLGPGAEADELSARRSPRYDAPGWGVIDRTLALAYAEAAVVFADSVVGT
jgi:HEPN domain-containing protein